ncbi:MAG TPA: hypothetical protein VMJ64_10015 [Anaerolineales bacterium]|nr:hypothetical protein [Anaerolineales bacterium]
MDLARSIIHRFDAWLSRVEHVESFAEEPFILLRLQRSAAARDIRLPGRTIRAGSPVVVLHFWNERIPPIGSQGPDMEWAIQFQRRLIQSLKGAARFVQQAAVFQDAEAVGGVIVQIHLVGQDGGRLLVERLGFTVVPYHRPAGAFGEFWENFYTWLLIWTYNRASLHSHSLLSLQRNEFWMTKDSFLERFASS